MEAQRQDDLNFLNRYYESGLSNILVVYGHRNIEQDAFLMKFMENRKSFFYSARSASSREQLRLWSEELKKDGITPTVISMHTIKPIDKECILNLINKGYKIYTFEEHTILGGLGSVIAEIIAESGNAVQFKRIGINDEFSHIVGNSQFIREQFKLDKDGILKQIFNK